MGYTPLRSCKDGRCPAPKDKGGKSVVTRFVTRNYVYETGSMTGILGQLKWESLKKRRKDNRLILLYKGLKGKARIPSDILCAY